ncbi:hypothetical protein NPIL_356651 [Nephila pilipes]|uniref:Secreted protein n=1 Tax=Nephila pilipes TaxID=299642 RepID=A0A8X6QHJ8_NEPPI|nr:hypothetical protein NPIL_249181 [Nephila pilipes]GFU27033.1 hypothetical protein NPIL_356651 [Nephila pilipes]
MLYVSIAYLFSFIQMCSGDTMTCNPQQYISKCGIFYPLCTDFIVLQIWVNDWMHSSFTQTQSSTNVTNGNPQLSLIISSAATTDSLLILIFTFPGLRRPNIDVYPL